MADFYPRYARSSLQVFNFAAMIAADRQDRKPDLPHIRLSRGRQSAFALFAQHRAAIWQLDLDLNRVAPTISLRKIKDFRDYLDKPYTEVVNW